ncbi:MAG: acylphosphatase [Thermoanaerobaculia bacterium]|nr:MAG: acylphosphatase [Thermoanaerobaculia bacterium]
MSARLFRVAGRVQGVGFRWFVVRLARACAVSGAVRNEADGAVTAYAEGTEEGLARFRAGLEQGPPAARVARVEESPAGARATAGEFDVEF